MDTARHRRWDLREDFALQGWLLLAAPVLFACLASPIFYPDTTSYLAGAVTRAPAYPLLLDAMRALLGDHWPRGTMILQGLLAGWSARAFARMLQARLRSDAMVATGLGAMLLLPQLTWIPSMLTESLCHSLFLLAIVAVFGADPADTLRSFARAALAVALAVAVRPHFIFLCPVLCLTALAWAWHLRNPRLAAQTIGLLLVAVVAASAAEVASNAARHGLPVRAKALGVHAASVQLYLSSPADVALFSDPTEHAFAQAILQYVEQHQLFSSSVPDVTDTVIGFEVGFDDIIYRGLVPQARARTGHADLTAADWVALDKASQRLAGVLLRHHPGAFLRHVVQQLRSSGVVLLLMLAALALGARLWVRRQDRAGLLLATAALLSLANHMELALVQVTRMRYVMTTDLVLVCILLAMWGRTLEREPDHASQ